MSYSRKRSPFQTLLHWSGMDLITLRSDCQVAMVRMESALAQHQSSVATETKDNTEALIRTLSSAMIALSDLESERNIATHNATAEKASHARTIGLLDKANKRVQQLELEGARLRAAIEKHMTK